MSRRVGPRLLFRGHVTPNYGPGLGELPQRTTPHPPLDYKHVTADRIVMTSGPYAAESVARLSNRRQKARVTTSKPPVAMCPPATPRTRRPPRPRNDRLSLARGRRNSARRDGTREVSTPCGYPYLLSARRSSWGGSDSCVNGAEWISP